jgi:hypothetical protein
LRERERKEGEKSRACGREQNDASDLANGSIKVSLVFEYYHRHPRQTKKHIEKRGAIRSIRRCTHTYRHTHTNVQTYADIQTCRQICIYTNIHTKIHTEAYIQIDRSLYIHTVIHTQTYVHTHVYSYTWTDGHSYMQGSNKGKKVRRDEVRRMECSEQRV